MKHNIKPGTRIIVGGHSFEATGGTFEFVADEPAPLRGFPGSDAIFDDLSFEASGEVKMSPGAIGFLARLHHRAGRNRRKALRRKRGGP